MSEVDDPRYTVPNKSGVSSVTIEAMEKLSSSLRELGNSRFDDATIGILKGLDFSWAVLDEYPLSNPNSGEFLHHCKHRLEIIKKEITEIHRAKNKSNQNFNSLSRNKRKLFDKFKGQSKIKELQKEAQRFEKIISDHPLEVLSNLGD